MSAVDAASLKEYVPRISKSVNLDDTAMRSAADESLIEMKYNRPSHVKVCQCLSRKDCCCARDASFVPILARGAVPSATYSLRERPKLVSVDVFEKSLLGIARSVTSKEVGVDASPDRRMNTFPLIEAFKRVVIDKHMEGFNLPSVLFADSVKSSASPIVTPKPEVSVSSQSSQSSPIVTSKLGFSVTPPSASPIVTPAEMVAASPIMIDIPNVSHTLSPHEQIRLVRILEKISGRRILHTWRIYWKRKKREDYRLEMKIKELIALSFPAESVKPVPILAPNNDSSDHPCTSSVMSASLEALENSRRIREELATIHTTQSVFKSVRVLLADTVCSPDMMDSLLSNFSVRLCVSQPTLHPKALVLVAAFPEPLTRWMSTLDELRCYFSAIDVNFPFMQSTQPGLPWEVRVRTDMAVIVPNWQ